MEFANPIWLNALFFAPVLLVILFWGSRRRQAEALAFTGGSLNPALAPGRSWRKNLLKVSLKVGTYVLLVLALARPQFGKQLVKVEREGIDVVIALDVSLSMLAEDMKPNRLDRAKHEIIDFIGGLKGDRIGIVAFAGDAVVLCPLTVDYNAARMFASSADIDLVPTPGSALHKAIETSVGLFPESDKHDRAVILVTDGEGHTGDPVAAAEMAAAANVRIFTIGIGRGQGELIPLRGVDGSASGYKKDRSGETVLTRLDETTLRRIARATDGKYLPATREGLELQVLYKEMAGLESKSIEGEFMERKQDRFVWFLGLALLLLGLDAGVTRRGGRRGIDTRRILHTGAAIALMLVVAWPATADAKTKKIDRKRVTSGNRYYDSGEYQKALSLYREAIGDSLATPKHAEGVRYNEGNALHMLGDLEPALNAYNRSFADDDSLQAGRMLYNRGNTLLKMSKLDDAIESYVQALSYLPDDADARHNLEMALKMKQQQEQQQQQQDDQNQENQDQQDQQDQENDEQQNQDQQEQGEDEQQQGDEQQQNPEQDQQQQQPDSNQVAPPDSTRVQSIELTKDDALRILQLLEEQEKELQKKKRKAAFKRAARGKDW